MNNAESETPGTWGVEGRSDQRSDFSDSQRRSGEAGTESGGLSVGASGATWAGGSLAGGILTRLIQDTNERLNEVRECIDWYQREEEKQLKRLEDLQVLQQLAEQQPDQEVE